MPTRRTNIQGEVHRIRSLLADTPYSATANDYARRILEYRHKELWWIKLSYILSGLAGLIVASAMFFLMSGENWIGLILLGVSQLVLTGIQTVGDRINRLTHRIHKEMNNLRELRDKRRRDVVS